MKEALSNENFSTPAVLKEKPMVENENDEKLLKEVDQYEKEEYTLHESEKEPELRLGGTELMWLALHEPELHEVIWRVINNDTLFEEIFNDSAAIHQKRFMELLKIFLAAAKNLDSWLASKEREEFDNYILMLNHHFNRKTG